MILGTVLAIEVHSRKYIHKFVNPSYLMILILLPTLLLLLLLLLTLLLNREMYAGFIT